MRVAIPHNLDRQTVRDRLHGNSHRIADQVPGGMADVQTSWPNPDTMELVIGAMGQELRGELQIEEGQVVFVMNLPPALSFLEPMIGGAIEQSGRKMLEAPSD